MNPTRILLVDDDVPLSRLIAARLEKTGRYTVRLERIPHAALKANQEFQPQLWLLDVEMPGITGPDLAKQLRKEPGCAAVPTLFLTSLISADEAGQQEMISNGNRYLSKSASIQVIGKCIDRLVA